MKRKSHRNTRHTTTQSILRLPDLEHAKTAVLNSLTSQDAQRGYRHAIDEFVDWYCSEPRLAFNRIVEGYPESRAGVVDLPVGYSTFAARSTARRARRR